MTYLISLASFAFVMSITPGPNNIMLWASGANYGFKRTLPHLLGVNLGFSSLIFLCGLGLGAAFEAVPVLQTILKVVGTLYLLYLAYRIATASFRSGLVEQKPLSFLEAASFQYANPKAWVIGLTAMSAFVIPNMHFIGNAALITFIITVVNLPCISVWAVFGTFIGRFLTNRKTLLLFNFVMAGLLVGTVALLF